MKGHKAKQKKHDELNYRLVKPYFTLIFPLQVSMDTVTFTPEVIKQSRIFPAFDFCIRCAALNKDVSNNYYNFFLVPDESYGKLLKFHDRLYAGNLFPHRRLQVDFIPQIGIGSSKDPHRCLVMIEKW